MLMYMLCVCNRGCTRYPLNKALHHSKQVLFNKNKGLVESRLFLKSKEMLAKQEQIFYNHVIKANITLAREFTILFKQIEFCICPASN